MLHRAGVPKRNIVNGVAALVLLGMIWAAWTVPAWTQGDAPTPHDPKPPAMLPDLPIATAPQGIHFEVISEPKAPTPVTAFAPPTPLGIQQSNAPNVSLQWINKVAPLRIHEPAEFGFVVRNGGPQPAQDVIVRTQVPSGMTVVRTEPKANVEGNIVWWELGALTANQERKLQLEVKCSAGGSQTCYAWVTSTTGLVSKFVVGEPHLTLKTSAPRKVLLGNPTTVVLAVTNAGDAPAEQVKLCASFSEGLEYPQGKSATVSLGRLDAHETRTVSLNCGTRAGGQQKCDVAVEGAGAVKCNATASLQVIVPRLNLEVAGPKLRYLHRKAAFSVRVANPTEAPIPNAMLQAIVPAGLKFQSASDGGKLDPATRSVSWILGEIAPFQTRTVRLETLAEALGDHHLSTTVRAAHDVHSESQALTRVEGLAALVLEVSDTEDPIEVGAETTYQVRITNTGSKTETGTRLVCTIPDKMQFKSATGPTQHSLKGREVAFEPLGPLAPGGEVKFRITVKGTGPGDVRFKAQITSANLAEPLIEMEPTRIYED